MSTPPDSSSAVSGSASADGAAATGKKTEVVSFEGSGSKAATSGEPARTEMPVSAVARLLGVATATDLGLMEGKMDLIIGKVNALQSRMARDQLRLGAALHPCWHGQPFAKLAEKQ